VAAPRFLQRDQPPGVPPLALDGERTLPDVPEENYWFRRHLAVYEWIAGRLAGLHVVDLAETFTEPADAVVFLQTIEHVADPGAVLENIRAQLRPGGVAYVSTPNVLTLAPPGAERSGNPWHVREYRPEDFHALCAAHFAGVQLLGLVHARALRAHAVALRLGWDRVHRALRLTKPFYDRFVPAISARDFALRAGAPGDLHGALDLVAVLRP
jgi:SAM-dependent methyltransferase